MLAVCNKTDTGEMMQYDMVKFPNGKYAIRRRHPLRWFHKDRFLDLDRYAVHWIPQIDGDFVKCLGDEEVVRDRYTLLLAEPEVVDHV